MTSHATTRERVMHCETELAKQRSVLQSLTNENIRLAKQPRLKNIVICLAMLATMIALIILFIRAESPLTSALLLPAILYLFTHIITRAVQDHVCAKLDQHFDGLRLIQVYYGDDTVFGKHFGADVSKEVSEIENDSEGAYVGTVVTEEVAAIENGYAGPILLVKLYHPTTLKGELVEFLTLSPREVGETLETIRTKNCAISIGRVRPGMVEQVRKEANEENTQYIGVGRSIPFSVETY